MSFQVFFFLFVTSGCNLQVNVFVGKISGQVGIIIVRKNSEQAEAMFAGRIGCHYVLRRLEVKSYSSIH